MVAGAKDEIKDESCTNAIGRVAEEDVAMQFAVHPCPLIVSEINVASADEHSRDLQTDVKAK